MRSARDAINTKAVGMKIKLKKPSECDMVRWQNKDLPSLCFAYFARNIDINLYAQVNAILSNFPIG